MALGSAGVAPMPSPLKALEAFTEQNPDLLRLENLLKRFNLFEAVGVVRHELRHSDFLAYLLDPSQNHCLGSTFLKEFLQAVRLTAENDSTLSLLDLDGLNLSQACAFREWHHIDILVVDEANRFAVIIENKIGTGEHSDQLNRYQADFNRYYPEYKSLALYLTPDGDAPSLDNYQAVSYKQVCAVIENLAKNKSDLVNGEIVMVLEHYAQMLRRHILSDSDIAELCRSIYQRHRQALDLIYEHRPDQQAQINDFVRSLIQKQPNLTYMPKHGGKTWIPFWLKSWNILPSLNKEVSNQRRWLLYFEFLNLDKELKISLTIGPGDNIDRERLLRMAQVNNFPKCSAKLAKNTTHVSTLSILGIGDYEKTQDEIEAIISEKWTAFLRTELPRMEQAMKQEEWLWTLP